MGPLTQNLRNFQKSKKNSPGAEVARKTSIPSNCIVSYKQVYDDKALDEFDSKPCQFFAYKTNFGTLEDVFKMSKIRAALKKDQWYVGW